MMQAVDPTHDPLRPLDRTRNQRFCPGAWAGFVQSSGFFRWRATRMPATIAKTRLRPSSMEAIIAYSLFVRLRCLRGHSEGLGKGRRCAPITNRAALHTADQRVITSPRLMKLCSTSSPTHFARGLRALLKSVAVPIRTLKKNGAIA